MEEKAERRSKDKVVRYSIIAVIIFFVVWAIYAIVNRNQFGIFDRFFSAFLGVLALVLYKRMRLSIFSLAAGLAVLVLHHFNLYGNFYFGWPFDRHIHFLAGLVIAIFFAEYLSSSDQKSRFAVFFFSVWVAAGLASFMEIIEFIGYSILGEGEGLLFYGTGDFGEWNNISWDLISNTAGAIFGALVYMSIAWFKRRN